MPELKDIPRFPNYATTRDGQIWSKPRTTSDGRKLPGRWLKSRINGNNGYVSIFMCIGSRKYNCSVHRLVLETFIGPCPAGMECRHLNGIRTDNRLENLCWGTRSENRFDAVKHGTHVDNRGEKCGTSKLSERDVRMIIYMYHTGLFLQREIAKIYNVTRTTITQIINKKRWGHLWVN